MNIVDKKIDELIPYEKNPRINDNAVDYVGASIREFGFKVPLVVDSNNVIIAGHTRLKAAMQLGMKTVPCIVADDLTPEQVKAFRLADNKVSEYSSWDFGLLDSELDGILDIDMGDFGFTFFEEEEEENKEFHRDNTIKQYNLDMYDGERTEGFYQMPIIKPCEIMPSRLIGFNYAMTSKDKDTGIHFFVDDYQFERVWNQPMLYLDKLSQYECVLTPDFSLYMDMPMAMKVWNIYRSRLVGQVMQDAGIEVIPTVSWAEPETFTFCFDGLPLNATLAVSTIGVKKHSMDIWKAGMDAMIDKLHPETIILYGGMVEYDFQSIKAVSFENEVTERMKGVV